MRLVHQARDAVLADALTPIDQVTPHARAPVGAIALREALSNQAREPFIGQRAMARAASDPGVEAAMRDF